MVSGNTYLERNDERIADAERRRLCAAPGPWGSVCTDHPGHRYSHYDSSQDRNWQDDWLEDAEDED